MASWLKGDRKWAFRTGALLTGWVLGTSLPNTVGAKWLDRVGKLTNSLYKDARKEGDSQELIQEVFEDLQKQRGYPVKGENIHFRLTTNINPSIVNHKGCSRLAPAYVVLPMGMRPKAIDIFYLHCSFDRQERLDALACFNREERKFLYALTTLYTEDNFALYSTAIGAGILLAASLLYLIISNRVYSMKDKLTKSLETVADNNILFQRFAFRAKSMTFLMLATASLALYFFSTRTLSLKMERDTHELIANLGKDYAKGGVGFYFKVLTYNSFFAQRGMDFLTPAGDEIKDVTAFFPTKMTFSEKLDIYISKLSQEEIAETTDLIAQADKMKESLLQEKDDEIVK